MAPANHNEISRLPRALGLTADLIGLCGILLFPLLFFPALLPAPKPDVQSPPATDYCLMDRPGYLRGKVYGALQLDIDWTGESLSCEGMYCPNNNGIRLFFSGNETELAVVIGIDGRPGNMLDRELNVNVTVIDRQRGWFYSTGGQDRCWTRIDAVELYRPQAEEHYRVDGVLYCAGALPSLNDSGSITLGDIHYSGRLSSENQ